MMIVKAIFPLLLLIAVGCKKCLDCKSVQFSGAEDKILAPDRLLAYSDGVDTLSTNIVKYDGEAAYEDCARKPQCLSQAKTSVYLKDTNGVSSELLYTAELDKTDKNTYCTFEVGAFSLSGRGDSLYSKAGYYQIVRKNYTYNLQNYSVQEVSKSPEGSALQITRFVYHPDLGFLEFTYSNPTKTYTRVR